MLFLVDHVTKVFFFVTECLCLMVPWKLFISSRLKIKPALCVGYLALTGGLRLFPFLPYLTATQKNLVRFSFLFFPLIPSYGSS